MVKTMRTATLRLLNNCHASVTACFYAGIGEDIKTVQFGWPLGMPLVDHMGGDLWEVRVRLNNRIARVLFAVEGKTMVLLHGFMKKQQATPKADLDLARDRLRQLRRK